MKKILISLLCVMMVACMMPGMALAEGEVTEVATYEELVAALAEDGANVKMTADITADATQSSGYGKAGIVLDAGDVLDGNGKKLTITSANSTWDCAVAMRGGEVKNLTIAGAMRGVFMPGANGDVVIDTCTFENVIYTFNSDAGSKDYSVTIKNTTLNGWTSFSDVHKSVTFEGCIFGEGNGYSFCRPYQATTFENCDFDGGFLFDNSQSDELEFNDCTYDEEPLSADNNEMFYNGGIVEIDGSETNVSYVAKIGEERYLSLADAFDDIADGDVVIELLRDAELGYGAREAYGTAETVTITINGNGKTLTMHQTDTDWSSFGMANAEGKTIINDLAINKTTAGGNGAWNNHAINWYCDVEMNNVTVNNSVAFSEDAVLNDVTINETGDYYAIWITAEGQTVDIDGLTVNSAGRGIKIADQYVTPMSVVLKIENARFDTVKKAAVLVSSTEGATIRIGENVDISNVIADQFNVVWVDEDWSEHADKVIVENGFMAIENQIPPVPSVGGGILVDNTDQNTPEAAIYFEILNVPADTEVLMELFADDKKLTFKKFNTVSKYDALGCSFYTIGTSSSWKQDAWTAHDHVMPTHAVLYFDGVEVESDLVEFTPEQWESFPGTLEASIGGGILVDTTATNNEAGICFEALNVADNDTVKMELYSGTDKLVTKQFTFTEGGTKTCTFYTVGTSSSWIQTPSPWKAYDCKVPTHAVLYLNDVEIGSDDVEFTAQEWAAFAGTNTHVYSNGTCTICGGADPNYVPPQPPTYTPSVTIQKPVITTDAGAAAELNILGNTATITVAEGYELVDVTVNGVSKGTSTTITGLKTGDTVVVVTALIEAPEEDDAMQAADISAIELVARSKVTKSPKGKDAILITWYDKTGADLDFDGVEIFRSTKKSSGFKKVFTSKTDKYYNTAIEEGVKYYYKVRGYVTVDGEKVYTDWSLKAIRTAK